VTTRLLALTVLALALLTTRAYADDDAPEQQKMRFIERDPDLTVTTSISKLFDSAAYEALDTGFSSTVEIQLWVFPQNSNEPIAYARLVRSVVYDLWDEDYTLRIGDRTLKVKQKSEALKLLYSLDDVPVAKLSDMPYDGIYSLAVRADLNPVSKETLAEVRRWLSQGTGGGIDHSGAFFGSFVSVFVNPKIPEADRVLRLRSQPFFRPKP
jgi:hypothetical protein